MATQTSSSNTRLIAIGAVVLLVGVILVLLILRGTVGGDDPVDEAPIAGDDGDDGDAGATGQADPPEADDGDLVTGDETSTARVDLPLDLAEGQEAVTVRASFTRGAAALPAAGDRVVAYQLGGDGEREDEDAPAAPGTDDDAQRVLDDVEVLGVIGPRPAANDGTLTFVLAVDETDVAGLLPIARDGHLWLTLRPGTDDVDGGDE